MSLGEQLVQELMQQGGAELPLQVTSRTENLSAFASFSQWSPLAVGVEFIKIEGSLVQGPLGDFAAHLARTLNYLNEPIRVFELDSQSQEAQLRSDPPKSSGDGVDYFEIRLFGDGSRLLSRYRNVNGGPRVTTPFTLTLETLARVIDDLSSPSASK
jgi:hypothetical protein